MTAYFTLTFAFLRDNGIDPDKAIAYLYELYGMDTTKFVVDEDSIILYVDAADANNNNIPDFLDSLIDPGYLENRSELGHGD